ncbi:MAG: hypothetical protein ACXABY_02950 [Candidatus Thorarchaeota archaeon]
MGVFNTNNISFARQVLLPRVSRPQAAIALYPQNAEGTTLTIQVGSTSLVIRYNTPSADERTINYSGRSVKTVVDEINQQGIPIRAVALSRALILNDDDFVPILGAGFVQIPDGFDPYSRIDPNGVILRIRRYTVRQKSLEQIKILPPYLEPATLPWYPRVRVGAFTQKFKGRTYHFGVPEYEAQTWSLRYGKPFRDIQGAVPASLGNNAYQVSRKPIFWNGENILLFNGDSPISTSVIEDVDIHNGIVYLNKQVFISDELTLDYTYLERSFEYRHININGHFTQNPSLIDKYVLLYLLPLEGTATTRKKRTLFHVVADSIEEAIDSINVDEDSIPIAIIGAYNIQQVFASDRANMLDTRVKGGGLADIDGPTSPVHLLDSSLEDERVRETPVEDLFHESFNFYDIGNWDGEAYPGAAAVVTQLPDDLKEVLPVKEIQQKAHKFIALGTSPVFRLQDRELPAISGLSSQVSAFINGSLDGTTANGTLGAGWITNTYELPQTLSGAVPGFPLFEGFDIRIPVIAIDGGYVLESSPVSGYLQPYLKSTPTAGISWEERTVVKASGDPNNPERFTEWTTKKFLDTREVQTGHLMKGYFAIDPQVEAKQYTDIRINSPYRADLLSGLLESIGDELRAISGTLGPRQMTKLDATSSPEGFSIPPSGTNIVRDYDDITDLTQFATTSDYVGAHPAYDFLFELIDTDLEPTFSGLIDSVGADLLSSLKPSGEYFRFFSVGAEKYSDYSDSDTAGVSLINPIRQLSQYMYFRRKHYGVSDALYVSGKPALTGCVGALIEEFDREGYPVTYTYSGSILDYGGEALAYPEDLGYSLAEVGTGNNDHLIQAMTPSMMAPILAAPDPSGKTFAEPLSGNFKNLAVAFTGAVSRVGGALYNTKTIEGIPTVNHWYAGYDRYGEYAGSLIRQYTQAYDYVYKAQAIRDAGDREGLYEATDLSGVQRYFATVETALDTAYTGLCETLLRGGVVDAGVPDLLYGYGWYVDQWARHTGLTSTVVFDPDGPLALQNIVGAASGLFFSGLDVIMKSMLTTEGTAHETTYVDMNPGPFESVVPAKILDTLAVASVLNPTYTGYAQGMFTTIRDLYSNGGVYWTDSTRNTTDAGREDTISLSLARMYRILSQTGVNLDG